MSDQRDAEGNAITPPTLAGDAGASLREEENRRGISKDVVSVCIGLLLLLLISWSVLAWLQIFYLDDEQERRVFTWSLFNFFLTKGATLKISGAGVFAVIGTLVIAATKLFKSETWSRTIARACLLGGILTILLWVQTTQDEAVLGEITAMAGDAFPADPAARVARSSEALDYLMGSILGWWLAILGGLMGLKALDEKGWTKWLDKLSAANTKGGA